MCEGHKITALKLNTDGKVITACTPLPAGHTGMPGAAAAWNKLNNPAIPPKQKMGRDPNVFQLRIIGMFAAIQLIRKKLHDTRPAKFIWRQAYIVYHQQFNLCSPRSLITIRRYYLAHAA